MFGVSGRAIELYAGTARALDRITDALSIDAAAAITSGTAKMTREEVVQLASLEDPDTMRAVWDEWLRAGKAGLAKLIAKHKQGKPLPGTKSPPTPATERYKLPDLVSLIAEALESSRLTSKPPRPWTATC